MQKITPFLWFDGNAEAAMERYTATFQRAGIGQVHRQGETLMSASFQLEGQQFMALNGGPHFKLTPAISFFVNIDTEAELDAIWAKLAADGKVLMELNAYPFSEKFGWLEDRFGVSWQLNLGTSPQRISPFLMFVGDQFGKAEEAINRYVSLFDNSEITSIIHTDDASAPTVQYATFTLSGQSFMAIDSGGAHNFTFTEAFSLFVSCKNQAEVDFFWEELSAGGNKGRCGWLKDKYGVSWQIIPDILSELLYDPDPAKAQSVMNAMLQMDKLDITRLQAAHAAFK